MPMVELVYYYGDSTSLLAATGTGNVIVTVLGVPTATSSASAFTVQTCTTNCMISGQVTGPWNHGVSVALSGGASTTTTTDANGNYNFTGLTAGTYTITVNSGTAPALQGYNFAPSSYSGVTVPDGNITGENFTGDVTGGFIQYLWVCERYSGALTGHNTLINVYSANGGISRGNNSLRPYPQPGAPSISSEVSRPEVIS